MSGFYIWASMFKRLKKWMSRDMSVIPPGDHSQACASIIPRREHGISRQDISEHALKVLYRLKKNGFKAYLVGGGVRDLLLGHHPKDFDIATDAKPEDIRDIFNNCRLIGRRFRLAHIYFGRDIIEVATFRGKGEEEAQTSHTGMLLRDNVYGTIEEDVWRRDFTMNALYYNIQDFSLVDFCGGLNDIKHKILRMIGEPNQRFREDPVRMLRAIRLACKLKLNLAKDLPPAMIEQADLISHVPAARLFEETLKLFHSGAAVEVYHQLKHHNLFYQLFPFLQDYTGDTFERFFLRVLENTDNRIKEGKSVNPAFIFAAILWYPLQAKAADIQKTGVGLFPATVQASEYVLSELRKRITIPRRFVMVAKDIWLMQIRLERKQSRRVEKLIRDQRFRASYDFLLLRGDVGECEEIALWWRDIVEGDPQAKKNALKSVSTKNKKRKRKRNKKADENITE